MKNEGRFEGPVAQEGGTPIFWEKIKPVSQLMDWIWTPTPWVINVYTRGRETEMHDWCIAKLGPESSPIHQVDGVWHMGSVTIYGWTWMGFKTEVMMRQFEAAFQTAPCVNHCKLGCDPDATAELREVYKGDELIKTLYLCHECRGTLAIHGFDLFIPDPPPCNERVEISDVKVKDESALLSYIALGLAAVGLYFVIACAVFQWRNPTANGMSVYRHLESVLTFEKLGRYQ